MDKSPFVDNFPLIFHHHIGIPEDMPGMTTSPSDALEIRQRPRARVDGAVQARVADAEVVEGTRDVRQKRIPLAKDDALGLKAEDPLIHDSP